MMNICLYKTYLYLVAIVTLKLSNTIALCNNNVNFVAECPYNVRELNLTDMFIPDYHNRMRHTIASGKYSCLNCEKLPKAVRMVKIQWNKNLAQIALQQVKTCTSKRLECIEVPKFSKSSQNIALFSFNGRKSRYVTRHLIESRIGSWYYEGILVTKKDVDAFPVNGYAIAKFALLANQRNSYVGCAAVEFSTSEIQHHFLLTCNYAVDNEVGKPMYKTGDISSSECITGKAKLYNLCNLDEYEISEV